MFQTYLRQARPGISRCAHLRNCRSSNRNRIVRRKDCPVLSRFQRSLLPIESRERQSQTHNAEVFANSNRGKTSEEVSFNLSASLRVRDRRALKLQTQTRLAHTHADVALIRRCRKKRIVGVVGAAAVAKRIEIDRAVRRSAHRTEIDS